MTSTQDQIKDLEAKLEEIKKRGTNPPIPETVKLPDRDYSVGKYPVTFDEYDAFCEATGREKPDDNEMGRGDRPVINVSWDDAQAYIEWLNSITDDDLGYRLPTVDEFVHFCGDHIEASEEIAVYDTDKSAPVGSKKPNKYGLYDVLGNVWEWMENRYE